MGLLQREVGSQLKLSQRSDNYLGRGQRRLSPMTATSYHNSRAKELQAEALSRARGGLSATNYAAIIDGFSARGITDIRPRDNVLTYNAWKAVGRQVRKGERGVKVQTWIPLPGRKDKETGKAGDIKLRPRQASVFHITQTDAIAV